MYYCDTDSLLVDTEGARRLAGAVDVERLGALKVEGVFDEVELWGPKDYRFGTKERHKGVRGNATWLDASTVRQQKWSSLRGLLQGGDLTAPVTRDVTKHLRRTYEKGRVTAGGFVVPWRFPQDL